MDYSKVMKSTAVEGLRVEDLVKQYFEAAEQVQHARHTQVDHVLRGFSAYGHVPTDGAAVPAN